MLTSWISFSWLVWWRVSFLFQIDQNVACSWVSIWILSLWGSGLFSIPLPLSRYLVLRGVDPHHSALYQSAMILVLLIVWSFIGCLCQSYCTSDVCRPLLFVRCVVSVSMQLLWRVRCCRWRYVLDPVDIPAVFLLTLCDMFWLPLAESLSLSSFVSLWDSGALLYPDLWRLLVDLISSVPFFIFFSSHTLKASLCVGASQCSSK